MSQNLRRIGIYMEPLEVTAKFDKDGKIIPLRFTWKDRDYVVESTGRRWEDPKGKHILVMVPDGRIFELVYNPSEGRWLLARVESGGMAA